MHIQSRSGGGGGRGVASAHAMLEPLEGRALLTGLAPDPSFGDDGWATAGFSGDYADEGRSIALQADGKLIVTGLTRGAEWNKWRIFVARLNANGTVDGTFGKRGFFQTGRRWSSAAAYDVAVQDDGRIVVAGKMDEEMGAIRLTGDGAWDRSFGDNGAAVLGGLSRSHASSVYVEEDGDIVLSGEAELGRDQRFALARLHPDGSRDKSFGQDGVRTLTLKGERWPWTWHRSRTERSSRWGK